MRVNGSMVAVRRGDEEARENRSEVDADTDGSYENVGKNAESEKWIELVEYGYEPKRSPGDGDDGLPGSSRRVDHEVRRTYSL